MTMVNIEVFGQTYDIRVMNEDGIYIYYQYIKNKTELAVAPDGTYKTTTGWDYRKIYSGHIKIPNEVEINGSKLKVTRIGYRAFVNSGNISITIPDNMQEIYPFAFDNTTLETVYISDFKVWCKIDYHGGNPCLSAKKVVVNGSEFILSSNLVIPDGVEHIGIRAFTSTRILSVSTPSSLVSIGDSAFCHCERLINVDLKNSVEEIGNNAFSYCSGLESIKIPDATKRIGNYAFYECTGLKEINMPSSLTTLGYSAFCGCEKLSCPIEFSNNIKSIGQKTFSACEKIPSINFGNSIETIGEGAFHSCQSLTEIILPASLKEIGNSAFAYCRNISSLEIPQNVNTIQRSAFYGCSKLCKITFCGTVKIDIDAFKELYGYDKTYISYSKDPDDASDRAFDTSGINTKLLVPIGTKKIYEVTKGWNKFSRIEESELANAIFDAKSEKIIEKRFNLDGTVASPSDKGIIIEKYKDGSIRKVTIK